MRKKEKRQDFRIGFFCGLAISGIIAVALLLILNF